MSDRRSKADRRPKPVLETFERAPDFVLPGEDGRVTTFYETRAGMPTALLFGDGPETFADWPRATESWLAIVPGPPGQWIEAPIPMIGDDGRLRRALLGEAPPGKGPRVVALLFDSCLRFLQEIRSPTPEKVSRMLFRHYRHAPRSDTLINATPVLVVPGLFSPDLCTRLIAAHDADNTESGMVRLVDGQPAVVPDPEAKRRRDHSLTDPALVQAVTDALGRRLLPEIRRAFNYPVTRFERFKVVAYDAETEGHFALHRDNTTPDAAHRRFALTVNLNDGGHRHGDYGGGRLVFPEYGADGYAPPTGWGIAFSGGLLHEVEPVTRGRRYALITFLWGEEAQQGRAKG
ncbi:MAG: 2OG-Fe(II) oxygenase [Alphaproteobacteria bacterium]|jgi:predicted 2-oxoglutarate/Fe(II)-dependent dioxygenase YbiX|nr:2OG-Fe(II) oxygenase [Alphaproteobacteria bacterium]